MHTTLSSEEALIYSTQSVSTQKFWAKQKSRGAAPFNAPFIVSHFVTANFVAADFIAAL